MALPRLELIASRGDRTLSRIKYVMCATSSAADFDAIAQNGLRFAEGRPLISTDLVDCHDRMASGQAGRVMVWAVPADFHLGYGVFTTAYIDRAQKQVAGAPMSFASGRKQLSFYMSADTEASRVYIESEVARGYPLDQRPQFNLEPQHLVGSFESQAGFDAVVSQLDVSIRSLEQIDYERMGAALRELFRIRTEANAVQVPDAMKDIMIGTAESIILSRLRMMRWQGLAFLGYRFTDNGQPATISVSGGTAEQRHRMDELGRKLASSHLFDGDLSWLKDYVFRELELMRVELDGAELEAQPD